jgi:hypothetical protein
VTTHHLAGADRVLAATPETAVSTEIVKAPARQQHGNAALSLSAMTPQDAWRFAEALAGSGMLPRQYQGNAASVLWALEYGRAIGLDVITTTQSVHVIQGRATASADLMASLTRRAGHRMRITSEDERAEVVIFRADDPEFPFRAVWDLEKARKAKLLNKDTWQQYQGQMLRARAISECVRMACPEVLHGSIYTPEEVGANVDQDGNPVDAPVQPLRAVQTEPARDFVAEARAAADAEQVRAIYREASGTAPREVLDLIAEIGRQRATESVPTAEPEPVDAEVIEDQDGRATALDELRAAAMNAGIAETLADDFRQSYGVQIQNANVAQIREMAGLLRTAAA